jgi:hypothetical protein
VLDLVCVPGSVDYRILAGRHRDDPAAEQTDPALAWSVVVDAAAR